MQIRDSLTRIASPLHSQCVQPKTPCMISLNYCEGRCIFYDHRIPSHKCLDSDAAELVHAGVSPDIGPIRYLDVPGKCRSIGHDHFVPDSTVVSNMGLGHKQISVPDGRDTAPPGCPAVDRNELAYLIAGADHRLGLFAPVLQVLRGEPYRCKWVNVGFIAHRRVTGYDYVRFQPHAVPK